MAPDNLDDILKPYFDNGDFQNFEIKQGELNIYFTEISFSSIGKLQNVSLDIDCIGNITVNSESFSMDPYDPKLVQQHKDRAEQKLIEVGEKIRNELGLGERE